MAEQEVIKHTKKVFKIWGSNEHSFWQKVKEFFVEVFIIVFAITLSIWFHNKSEHAKEQEDVKHFLLGLKSDLKSDLVEMNSDKQSYLYQMATFQYLARLRLNEQVSLDSLKKYARWIENTTILNPNNGRFEGFKSSGKIGTIENGELQNDIMDLYQENIVALRASIDRYVNTKERLFDFIFKNRKRLTDSTDNIPTLLAQEEAHSLSISLALPRELISRYDSCINKANKIIGEIDKEYKLPE
jgi:hypothetical protein